MPGMNPSTPTSTKVAPTSRAAVRSMLRRWTPLCPVADIVLLPPPEVGSGDYPAGGRSCLTQRRGGIRLAAAAAARPSGWPALAARSPSIAGAVAWPGRRPPRGPRTASGPGSAVRGGRLAGGDPGPDLRTAQRRDRRRRLPPRRQHVEQRVHLGGHVRDGVLVRVLGAGRRLLQPGHLPDELAGGRLDLVVGGGRLEAAQLGDVAA